MRSFSRRAHTQLMLQELQLELWVVLLTAVFVPATCSRTEVVMDVFISDLPSASF